MIAEMTRFADEWLERYPPARRSTACRYGVETEDPNNRCRPAREPWAKSVSGWERRIAACGISVSRPPQRGRVTRPSLRCSRRCGLGNWSITRNVRPTAGASTLDADHLAKRVHDPDEIVLRPHDGVDVLVRGRCFVEHARVLAAFDAVPFALEIGERETVARLTAAHPAARAVRARFERVRIAETAHDERARTHRARDEAELAEPCANRTLARHVHVGTEVPLARDVVVVAVHGGLGAGEARELDFAVAQRFERVLHHDLAVEASVVLREPDGLDVRVERRRVLGEVGEIAVGDRHTGARELFVRAFDVVRADAVAHAARAGVQHEPDAAGLVEAHLAEVVAAGHLAELPA